MRKARFAECLLRSVTTPERAASTVGDLVETSAEKGAVWFWSSLLRTVGSQMWSGVASNPRGMFGLALKAWLLGLLYMLCFFAVRTVIVFFYILVSRRVGAVAMTPFNWPPFVYLSMAGIEFLMGRWIGRRAPGSMLSAVFALCILHVVAGVAFGMLELSSENTTQALTRTVLGILYCVPTIAGALTVTSWGGKPEARRYA